MNRRTLSATVAAVALAAITVGATFTALCGNGTSCAYNGTEPRPGMQTFNLIRTNFNDHETRILVLEGRVKQAAVTLSNAQVKALATTPIQLVAAPGSGYRIKLLGLTYLLNTSAGAYTNIDTSYASLWVGTSVSAYLAADIANDSAVSLNRLSLYLGATHSFLTDIPTPGIVSITGAAAGDSEYVTGVNSIARSAVENAALMIGLDNNGTGDLAGGNAANTLKVIVLYQVQAL